MQEPLINPIRQQAIELSKAAPLFIDRVKHEAGSEIPIKDTLSRAASVVAGQYHLSELLDTSRALHQELVARHVAGIKIQAYFFNTGVDLALRGIPGAFLLGASEFLKKLLKKGNLDRLAEGVERMFDDPNGQDVEELVRYFKMTKLSKALTEEEFKRRIKRQGLPKETEKSLLLINLQTLLFQSGYKEHELPGLFLMLGYLSGLWVSRALMQEKHPSKN